MDTNTLVVTELEQLKQSLQARLDSLQVELNETKAKYQSVLTTLELLGHKKRLDLSEAPGAEFSWLRGLTQAQALERIAKKNGGRVKVRDAKRILLSAGLIKTPKNANNIIFNVIQRVEGKFRRIAPGEYELVA